MNKRAVWDHGSVRSHVIDGEIEVAIGGYQGCLGLDLGQLSDHVVLQPGIDHGDQIAGIMAPVMGQPMLFHVLLDGLLDLVTEELARCPTGIDQGIGAQAIKGLRIKAAAIPMAIG